jgi:hypothetical protein
MESSMFDEFRNILVFFLNIFFLKQFWSFSQNISVHTGRKRINRLNWVFQERIFIYQAIQILNVRFMGSML